MTLPPPLSGYVHLQSLSICKTPEKRYCKAHIILHGGKDFGRIGEIPLVLPSKLTFENKCRKDLVLPPYLQTPL
jgi:hypothetical protein